VPVLRCGIRRLPEKSSKINDLRAGRNAMCIDRNAGGIWIDAGGIWIDHPSKNNHAPSRNSATMVANFLGSGGVRRGPRVKTTL